MIYMFVSVWQWDVRPIGMRYSVKRSGVTGNRFEWELGENKVI